MAINVITYFRNQPQMPTRDNFIAYPAPGYFPFALLPNSKRWLFWPIIDHGYINLNDAVVEVNGPNGFIPVKITYKSYSELGPVVVFEVTIPPSNYDVTYNVMIMGLKGIPIFEGVVSYDVIIFNA